MNKYLLINYNDLDKTKIIEERELDNLTKDGIESGFLGLYSLDKLADFLQDKEIE
jgi:hypothetical protein